tara:strand:- start:535 stop:741 length:207 start_codon:yes stop_codon:yes gene_type:complete
MNPSLDNKETLFILLSALVKRAGGTIQIEEEELIAVTKHDMITMKFNKTTNSVILKLSATSKPPSDLN